MPTRRQQDSLHRILLSAPSYKVRVGKLVSMYGELTSISSMGCDGSDGTHDHLSTNPNIQTTLLSNAFLGVSSVWGLVFNS